MRQSASENPFQYHAYVEAQQPCFAKELFDDHPARLAKVGITHFEPRVIIAPKMAGTTTQAYWISQLHEKHAYFKNKERKVTTRAIVPSSPNHPGHYDLQHVSKEIATALGSKISNTLVQMVETRDKRIGERLVLIIDVPDYLDHRVIRWILSNVQALVERSDVCAGAGIQVVITGAFTLSTLSGTPTSEYPLPTIDIPEFDKKSQKAYLQRVTATVKASVEDSAQQLLWRYTEGDKFLTQYLAAMSLDFAKRRHSTQIEVKDVRASKDYFINASCRDGKFFKKLSDFCDTTRRQGEESDALIFLEGKRSWKELSIETRQLFFHTGVVKWEGRDNLTIRAQIVAEAIEARFKRRTSAHFFFESWKGLLETVSNVHIFTELERKTLSSASGNDLAWLYIGFGRVKDINIVVADMEGIDGRSFHAEWEIALHRDIKVGDEVLVVSCSVLCEGGSEQITNLVIPLNL